MKTVLIAVLALGLVAGCGRKGDPLPPGGVEPPPEADPAAAPATG